MPDRDWDDPAIERRLREVGLRPTSQRRLILAYLATLTTHPTADDLYAGLRASGRPVGLPTLYQNLTRLVEAGLVHRFLDDAGLMRFDANVEPHHHLLCRGCGRIVDVHLGEDGRASLHELTAALAEGNGDWRVEDVRLGAAGLCPACAEGRVGED
jgi:Fe2+ or Zn2+ uptake regulation protein